ncbi:hypothetical protein FACS189459_2320 [Bacilli bacterium]|nr:hypothetical protein FACS189459_2320 [Bacilli bacterium]
MPIEPEFHKKLFPNSLLRGEKLSKDEVTNPTSYALENVYISFAGQTENSKLAKVGDIMLIYRKGNTEPKHFSSVVTTAIIITDIFRSFNNIDDFLSKVENRSVFTKKELELFYVKQKDKIVIVKFVLISALSKKVTLEKLRKLNIIEPFAGPRPFAKINDKQFNIILSEAKTEVKFSKVDENE